MQIHILNNLDNYRSLLLNTPLHNYTVIEFGAGTGVLTKLLCNAKPRKIIAYEICEDFIPHLFDISNNSDVELEIKFMDFTCDTDYITQICLDNTVCIISNPPYCHLSWIVDLINKCNIRNYILMTSDKKYKQLLSHCPIEFTLNNTDFIPHTSISQHHIVKYGFLHSSQLKLHDMIINTGGHITDHLFVHTPGCKIISTSSIFPQSSHIFEQLNLDTTSEQYEQLCELNSRITYLSFGDTSVPNQEYNKRLIQQLQHLSVCANLYVTFLICGISDETITELISHTEAKVARLTTSKTKAKSNTLYRIQGTEQQKHIQKQFILQYLSIRNTFKYSTNVEYLGTELFNINNLGSKCGALTYTMNLKDFHKLFIGRLHPSGNETEMIEICTIMCSQLHTLYPLIINHPSHYATLNNGSKLYV